MEKLAPHFTFFENESAVGNFNVGKFFYGANNEVAYDIATRIGKTPNEIRDFSPIDAVSGQNVNLSTDDSTLQTTQKNKADENGIVVLYDDNQNEIGIQVDFRLLSKTIVYQMGFFGMIVMDFGDKSVLKNSLQLLTGKPVMPDHSMTSEKWLGIIKNTFWTRKINGLDVEGINGTLELDIDPDPTHASNRIIRGIRKGPLSSFSVSVWFDYKRSHPDMDAYDFYTKMGEKDQEGNMYRLIVTKIHRYFEGSIVVAGADPHAKRALNFSDVNQPGNVLCSFSCDQGWHFSKQEAMVMSAKAKQDLTPEDAKLDATDTTIEETPQEDEKKKEEEVEAPAQDAESTPEGEETKEVANSLIKQNSELLTNISDLTQQRTTLQQTVDSLTAEKSQLEAENASLQDQLNGKNTELQDALTQNEALRKASDEYKAEIAPRLAFAQKAEDKFREDCEAVYRNYTTTLKNPLPESVMQDRIDLIKNKWSIDEVLTNMSMWQAEFESAMPVERVSKETPVEATDKYADLRKIDKSQI